MKTKLVLSLILVTLLVGMVASLVMVAALPGGGEVQVAGNMNPGPPTDPHPGDGEPGSGGAPGTAPGPKV